MRLAIDHTLRFEYSKPVFIEPFAIRLHPATNAMQVCESFHMETDPQPGGHSDGIGPSGFTIHTLWFQQLVSSLSIRVQSVVRTLKCNPFDYIMTAPGMMRLPAHYGGTLGEALNPCRTPGAAHQAVDQWVGEALAASGEQTLPFLNEILMRIHRDIPCRVRETGDPWEAAQTLNEGWGSCRDLAVLYVEACRRVGLAARFVSGYKLETDEALDEGELHAWAEVYLPGGGWRGFDPSIGLAVADRHVTLAAGHHPALAAPTSGTFRASEATTTLAAQVRLRPLTQDG